MDCLISQYNGKASDPILICGWV